MASSDRHRRWIRQPIAAQSLPRFVAMPSSARRPGRPWPISGRHGSEFRDSLFSWETPSQRRADTAPMVLKAPFRIAEDTTEDAIVEELEILARDTVEFSTLAATLASPLDRYRAPSTDAESARRRRSPLTPEEDRLMLLWGYPCGMARFRFDITLTGPVAGSEMPSMEAALGSLWRPPARRPSSSVRWGRWEKIGTGCSG